MSGSREANCKRVWARLPLVPGADLLPAEDAWVREHLRGCAACRKELGAFVHGRRVLHDFGSVIEGGSGQTGGGGPGAPGVDRSWIPDAEFFAQLRAATMTAVRRDAMARQRRLSARPRRSFASMMTAAALFLLGVYLMPERSSDPEPFVDVPSMTALSRGGSGQGVRFRNVGYGLMGHCLRFAVQPVPLDDEIVDESPDPVRVWDAQLIRKIVGAQQTPRRK